MLGISGNGLSVVSEDSAIREVKLWMTLCSLVLFLAGTDLCDFLHRLLLLPHERGTAAENDWKRRGWPVLVLVLGSEWRIGYYFFGTSWRAAV